VRPRGKGWKRGWIGEFTDAPSDAERRAVLLLFTLGVVLFRVRLIHQAGQYDTEVINVLSCMLPHHWDSVRGGSEVDDRSEDRPAG
jgi:hypothetical protein